MATSCKRQRVEGQYPIWARFLFDNAKMLLEAEQVRSLISVSVLLKRLIFPIGVPSLLSQFSLCHMKCFSPESWNVRQPQRSLPRRNKVIAQLWRCGGRRGSDEDAGRLRFTHTWERWRMTAGMGLLGVGAGGTGRERKWGVGKSESPSSCCLTSQLERSWCYTVESNVTDCVALTWTKCSCRGTDLQAVLSWFHH